MESSERRERDRVALRGKILDAARELFVEGGAEAMTMRALAGKVGYTAPTIYALFHDKDALLRALCTADFLTLREAFGRIEAIADPVERLRRVGWAYADFALEYPNHYRLLFMARLPEHEPDEHDVQKGNPDQDAYAFLRVHVEQAIATGRFRPEYSDADLVAQLLWASIHGVVSLELTKGDDDWIDWRPIGERVGSMIDATFRGLLARGD